MRGSKQLADYSCGGSPGLMTPARLHAPGSLLNTEEDSLSAYRMDATIKQYLWLFNYQKHNILIYLP
jgi:heme/copper-type cytochrome/quinol oxidase subunit 2